MNNIKFMNKFDQKEKYFSLDFETNDVINFHDDNKNLQEIQRRFFTDIIKKNKNKCNSETKTDEEEEEELKKNLLIKDPVNSDFESKLIYFNLSKLIFIFFCFIKHIIILIIKSC